MVDAGALGKLLFFETNASHDNFRRLAKDNWRLSTSSAPAGMMTAVGIHHTDLFINIAGPRGRGAGAVDEHDLRAAGRGLRHGRASRFKSGMRATLSSLSITPFHGRFTLYGDKGWVEIVSIANVDQGKPTILTHGDHSGRRSVSYEPTDTVTQNFEAWADAVEGRATVPLHRRGADREHPPVRGDRDLDAERRRAQKL